VKGKRRVSVIRTRSFALVLFCGCTLFGAAILIVLRNDPVPRYSQPGIPGTDDAKATRPGHDKALSEPKAEPPQLRPPADSTTEPTGKSSVTDADLEFLTSRNLLIPVANVTPNQLHDTFGQARSEGRRHDAIDIMAHKDALVLATTNGVVSKLFQSDRGGVTLYERDPSGRYIYYYAHLARYADGIAEGKQLLRGDVIAYVGDTGNAGAGNYHLHFAISKITSPRSWSGGDPINPYPLLVRE
jgi:murein DD-endopeptidase MepM/ murein hydrolase activator NlpD